MNDHFALHTCVGVCVRVCCVRFVCGCAFVDVRVGRVVVRARLRLRVRVRTFVCVRARAVCVLCA